MHCGMQHKGTVMHAGEAMLPSFDHGVGDPVADGVSVISQNKIVLVEGNYLLLGKPANC